MDLLSVQELQVGALPPLTFDVARGECLAVEGPSGVGKTRLLRAVADLDAAPGQIFLQGTERNQMTGPQWRRHVRFCAAEPAWWTDTPRDAFPADMDKKHLERLLTAVGLEADVLDRATALLSTGERQRLALVRAIADEPDVLLLDEPTAALDPNSASLVEQLITHQVQSGRAVVLVSHDHGQIQRLANARLPLAEPRHVSSRKDAQANP